jgi:uncharacterized membrane protein YraQ (UPF0718 family)
MAAPALSAFPARHPGLAALGGAAAWLGLYLSLAPMSKALVSALPLDPGSRLGTSLEFFLYDTPKVLMLLVAVVFAMGMINASFTPERTRALLAGRAEGLGNVLAAGLGTVTPFCSCSAVPLFIGFVQAGVPLGVTFSFLIAAPMVNEVALALLFALFGWQVALLYLGLGLAVAIGAGWVLGRMRLEPWLEDWVRQMRTAPPVALPHSPSWTERIAAGRAAVREIVGRVWPYVLGGIAVGAAIHGYVPQDLLAGLMGSEAWWSVPAAVLVGVPIYANAAGIVPIVQALLAKGAALGTALAFMMSVVALSLPELIILRRVLKPRLLAAFVALVASGILAVGYAFNAILG